MKKFTDYAATPKNKDWETLIKQAKEDELNKYKPIAIITNIESYKKSYNKMRYGKKSNQRVNVIVV